MTSILFFLGLGVLVALSGVLYRKYRSRGLPFVSDTEFLKEFHQRYLGNDEKILEKRTYVARVLGIPAGRLSPTQTPRELQSRIGFLADFYVSWDALLDDAEEARIEKGAESRLDPTIAIEDLVADLSGAERVR